MRPLGTTQLLDLLSEAQLDDEHSIMHEVISLCSVQALGALSATSRWLREHCHAQLQTLRKQQEHELAHRLGYFHHSKVEAWNLLSNLRALTIPDNLPKALQPLLGTWLQAEGRLAQVNCVRCRSWTRSGEVLGWIELESVRAGELQGMSPDERFALEKLDTPDGLLKTVLRHARKKLCKYDIPMLDGCYEASRT